MRGCYLVHLRGYLWSGRRRPAGKRRAPFRHSPKRRAGKHDASRREGGISSGRVRVPMGYRSSRGNSRHRTCLRAGRGSRPHDRARSTSRGPCRSRRSQEQSPQLPEPRSGPRKLFPAPREGQSRRGCRQASPAINFRGFIEVKLRDKVYLQVCGSHAAGPDGVCQRGTPSTTHG